MPVNQARNSIERPLGIPDYFHETVEGILSFPAEDKIRPCIFLHECGPAKAYLRTAEHDFDIRHCLFQVGCQNLDLFNIPNVARKANHIIVCSYKFRIDVIRIVVDRKFSYIKIAVFIRRDGIQILERKI